MGDLGKYGELLLRQGKPIPKDQFSHAYLLIDQPPHSLKDYQDLLHPYLLLGNISNDKLLYLKGEELQILTHIYGLAKRDKGLMPLFQELYVGVLLEINITRTYKGMERQLQTFIPPTMRTGFGEKLEEKGEGSSLADLIKSIRERNRQKGWWD